MLWRDEDKCCGQRVLILCEIRGMVVIEVAPSGCLIEWEMQESILKGIRPEPKIELRKAEEIEQRTAYVKGQEPPLR